MRELDKEKLGKFLDKHKRSINKMNIPEITEEEKQEMMLPFEERRQRYLQNKK